MEVVDKHICKGARLGKIIIIIYCTKYELRRKINFKYPDFNKMSFSIVLTIYKHDFVLENTKSEHKCHLLFLSLISRIFFLKKDK